MLINVWLSLHHRWVLHIIQFILIFRHWPLGIAQRSINAVYRENSYSHDVKREEEKISLCSLVQTESEVSRKVPKNHRRRIYNIYNENWFSPNRFEGQLRSDSLSLFNGDDVKCARWRNDDLARARSPNRGCRNKWEGEFGIGHFHLVVCHGRLNHAAKIAISRRARRWATAQTILVFLSCNRRWWNELSRKGLTVTRSLTAAGCCCIVVTWPFASISACRIEDWARKSSLVEGRENRLFGLLGHPRVMKFVIAPSLTKPRRWKGEKIYVYINRGRSYLSLSLSLSLASPFSTYINVYLFFLRFSRGFGFSLLYGNDEAKDSE